MHRSRIVLSLFSLLALLAGGFVVMQPAQARPTRPSPFGQDPITPGQAYTGDFPDPWIIRQRHKYVAYATTTGDRIKTGVNLPVLTSTDLKTWYLRRETPDAPLGDALPRPAAWAAYSSNQPDDGRMRPDQGPWAPAVAKVGPHHFVLAYAVQVAGAPGTRMCISLAHATSAVGPFVDSTTRPTVCPSRGAIDPQIFIAPNGRPWLVWKRDLFPARLFTQPMDRAATGVLPGKPKHYLARVKQPWEGSIIENPAMIRFKNRYYLFYSANSFNSTNYAIGYLICKSWKGGCYRPRKKPLLHTAGGIAGPGGPAPFVDTRGRLRVGYHAWSAGAVGYAQTGDPCSFTPGTCGQRRLYVARLKVRPNGRLQVKSYYH